ncbi:MAG: hypothetical protein WBH20_13715 [Oceanisphaera sp.]
MLAHHLNDVKELIYYLDGPPELVAGMKELLEQIGVDADQVRNEEFSGY